MSRQGIIAIVNDHESERVATAKYLGLDLPTPEGETLTLEAFAHSRELLARVAELRAQIGEQIPEIILIVTDFSGVGWKSIDNLLSVLQRERLQCPVIVRTGANLELAEDPAQMAPLEEQGVHVRIKPFPLDDLEVLVHELIAVRTAA